MPKERTLTERMTVIETLLQEAFKEGGAIPEMQKDIKHIRTDLEEHKQDYYALKNKGIGAVGAISVIFAGIGFFATVVWDKLTGALFG
jgi:hypothetical protein